MTAAKGNQTVVELRRSLVSSCDYPANSSKLWGGFGSSPSGALVMSKSVL